MLAQLVCRTLPSVMGACLPARSVLVRDTIRVSTPEPAFDAR
jgi:hypothetical protein